MANDRFLLIVDDEPDMLSLLRRTISAEADWEILTASSAEEALKIMSDKRVDVVLLDIKMPDVDGMELLSMIKDGGKSPTVVMMTAYGVIELAVEAIKKGAYDFVTKPFDDTRLLLTLKKAMEHHLLLSENKTLHKLVKDKEVFQGIIGTSPKMEKVFETIQTVSQTDATVLITGESGTGKELVAKAIHRLSARCKDSFVTVNCPTLPENILETELFGYVKGAFTDAKHDKRGLFQEAEGGTIFLDEIGDLPGSLQTKLLRVLQEREIKPLGHPRSFKVDVRVIASTNRNLKELLAKGRFREDLYYRLNVVSIELPPLRERKVDIPLLVDHFLRTYAEKFGKNSMRLAPGFVEALWRNSWPGNVRELEHSIERAVIMSKRQVLTLSDLDPEAEEKCSIAGSVKNLAYKEAKEQMLTRFNRDYLTQALSEKQGNVTKAARECGLERQAFQQLIRRYGIKSEDFRTQD